MTTVEINYHNNLIQHIKVNGHSGYAPRGEDLVCAGVSSIVFGTMNAIDMLENNSCNFEIKDADIEISVKKNSEKLQTILDVMIIQLQSLEESYSKFIKVKKEEV